MSPDQTLQTIERVRDQDTRSEILALLERDPRWSSLPHDFQATVLLSADQMTQLPFDEVLKTARDLDKNNDNNAYLEKRNKTEGSLMNAYEGVKKYLRRQATWRPESENSKTLERCLRIATVDRLIGNRLTKSVGWSNEMGFRTNNHHVAVALDLGKQAVRKFAT